MAFYKDLEDVKTPDWTGASKEPNRQPVDTSMEKLLSGLADTLGGAVDMFDRTQNEAIKSDTRNVMEAEVDKEYNRLGGMLDGSTPTGDLSPASAAGIGGEAARDGSIENPTHDIASTEDDDEPLPEEAASSLTQLGNLATAASTKPQLQGHYYNELYAKAKMLRNRYPGKADLVDKMVSHITGVDPANARLRARQAEVAANLTAAQKAQQDVWREYRGTDGQYIQAANGGTPQKPIPFEVYAKNRMDMMANAQMLKGQNLKADADIKMIQNNKQLGALQVEEAVTNRWAVDNSVFINGALSALKEKGLALEAKGKDATPEEIQAFQQEANTAIQKMENSKLQYLNTPIMGKDGVAFTLAQRLGGGNAAAELVKKDMQQFKDWAELYSDKNTQGIANAATNFLKMQKSTDMVRFYRVLPNMRVMDMYRQAAGDGFMTQLVMQNKSIMDDAQRSISDVRLLSILTGKVPENVTLNDIAAPKDSPESGKQNKLLIEQLKSAIRDGSPTQAKNAADVLYRDNKFFNDLSPEDKKRAWAMMTDPAYSQAVQKQPEVLQKHLQFLASNFPAIAKTDIDTVQKYVEFNRTDVQFQPDTMHFAFQMREGMSPGAFGSDTPEMRQHANDQAARAIGNLNAQIDRVAPALKQLYGEQAPQKLMDLMQGKGLNMNAEKKGFWLEETAKAIGGAISNTATDVKDAVKDKVQQILPDTSPVPKTPAYRPEKRSDLSGKSMMAYANEKEGTANLADRATFGRVFQEQGKQAEVRKLPIRKELAGTLQKSAQAVGVNVEVYSGGQDPKGKTVGTARHNHGNSADIRLFTEEDGKRKYVTSNTAEGRRQIAAFITESVKNGATGVGHGPGYMGPDGIHVGGGTAAVWGAKGKGENAPKWVKEAYERGIVERHYADRGGRTKTAGLMNKISMTDQEREDDDETNAMIGDMLAKEGDPEAVRKFGLEALKRRRWDELGVTIEGGGADLPVGNRNRFDDTLTDRYRSDQRKGGELPDLRSLEREMERRQSDEYTVDDFEVEKLRNRPRST